MVSIGLTVSLLTAANSLADIGVAGQSCNQSIRTAQAAQPQKVHQKEEKGSAAEAAACNFNDIDIVKVNTSKSMSLALPMPLYGFLLGSSRHPSTVALTLSKTVRIKAVSTFEFCNCGSC